MIGCPFENTKQNIAAPAIFKYQYMYSKWHTFLSNMQHFSHRKWQILYKKKKTISEHWLMM